MKFCKLLFDLFIIFITNKLLMIIYVTKIHDLEALRLILSQNYKEVSEIGQNWQHFISERLTDKIM